MPINNALTTQINMLNALLAIADKTNLSSIGGVSISKVNTAATTNATLVKSTAGRLYGVTLTNTTAALKYVKLFNKTSAPVPGTDTPVLVVAVPPNGVVSQEWTNPVTFASGIGYAVVGGPTDLDATALVAANEVVGALLYV